MADVGGGELERGLVLVVEKRLTLQASKREVAPLRLEAKERSQFAHHRERFDP